MIPGKVIFQWSDGHQQEIPFLHGLKGIQHDRQRPAGYRIEMEAGTISAVEAAQLSRWLTRVPAALGGRR